VQQDFYTLPYGGTYNSIDYAELTPAFMVRVGKGDPAASPPANMSTAFTYDSGATWFIGNATLGGITGGGTVAAAADASAVVWSPEGGGVSYSTDNGNSWIASTGLAYGAAFMASDRVNANKFYAFQSGTVYVSTDKGKTFTAKATGFPAWARIKAVPGVEGEVWMVVREMTNNVPTAAAGLYRSTDSGATFAKVSSANLTLAETVGFGKAATGQTHMAVFIYGIVDGVKGIYRSNDAGGSWVKIDDATHQFGATNQCITGDPRVYGRVYLCTNGFGIVYGDIAGAAPATSTPTRTGLPGITNTPTRTITPTIPLVITNTPTRTYTPGPTFTRTRTPTTGPSLTPTRTPTAGAITNTPTRTFTPPAITSTPTQPTGGACSPVTSTITAPFTYDGAGTFCWQSTNLGAYINSWNTTSLTVNGVNYTNVWASSASLPAKINGYWYVSYNSTVSWGHFEAK
jgi:hypothetical protein